MEKKKKRVFLEVGLIICIIILFVLLNEQITDDRKSSFLQMADSYLYSYQIDCARVENNELVIEGWILKFSDLNSDNDKQEISLNDTKEKTEIVLYDMSNKEEVHIDGSRKPKKGIKTSTILTSRKEIYSIFKINYDYSSCGFISKVNKKSIDIDNGNYQIIIKTDEDSDKGILAGYLIKGKLEVYDSTNSFELDVKGTDLETIVDKGICLVNNPDYNLCIYQYGWTLYWIIEKDSFIDNSDDIYMQCKVEEVEFEDQTNKIKRRSWKNLSIDYKNPINLNCGGYVVYKEELPQNNPFIRIVTGYKKINSEDWIWQEYFRPHYSR